ncbi:MAG: hypothetical protein IAG10_16195 [Planctomycetaceae bacterium]|nr:hypothetical protein [Planctomycetaceae bacterium]
MQKRLDALFYTFLVIFAATAFVTLLGVVKKFPIDQENLRWLLSAFLVELAGAVIALFRGAPFFSKDELAKNIDPAREDIEALKNAVTGIESKLAIPDAQRLSPTVSMLQSPKQKQDAALRIKQALASGQYTWRSVERLGVIGGVPESEALDILRADPDVILGVGKSGRQIAKLASK